MKHYQAVVHCNGPALWPEHKPLPEVLKLKATTPDLVWEGTYQGSPTPAGGYTFRREFWSGKNRYDATDPDYDTRVVARIQSWDTAEEDTEQSAYTVCVTGDILHDYSLAVRHVYRARLTFDVLPGAIESQARQWRGRDRLQWVVIEDKSSGKQALQTLRVTAVPWLRELLHAWRPAGSKEVRASAASVWCREDMVLLPHPSPAVPWLLDFEDELFSFPRGSFADQVDAFTQLILFSENYLAEGRNGRAGRR